MTANRSYALRAVPGLYASKPGIQVAVQTSHKASDEDLQFFQQLGVEWVMPGIDDPALHSVEHYKAVRRALCPIRSADLPHRQSRGPQRPGDYAQSARPRRESRRVNPIHPRPRCRWHSLSHVRPYGQRHLEHRPHHPPRRHERTDSRHQKRHGSLGQRDLCRRLDPRPRLYGRTNCGKTTSI